MERRAVVIELDFRQLGRRSVLQAVQEVSRNRNLDAAIFAFTLHLLQAARSYRSNRWPPQAAPARRSSIDVTASRERP